MYQSYLDTGKKVELEFAKVLVQPVFSSKEEDINEHWDVMDEFNGYKYDVKAMKKRRRSETKPNPHYHWIELTNVNGKAGWLYGQADFIAFEIINQWIIVNRIKLACSLNDINIVETRTRRGRLDKILLIESVDLIIISDIVVRKEK